MSAVVKPAAERKTKFDPIMLEVVRNLLIATMDECEINLSRTAFSPIIYEVKDYCIGLLDHEGRTIAQSRGSVPTFMADLGDSVKDGLAIYGPEGIEPGDVLLMNFSDICGQHLNNVVVYLPVHLEGRLIGFMASRAHWSDVGGRVAGSVSTDTTEIFQEGLQLRSIKVYKRGKRDEEIIRIIRHNLRLPELSLGDMEAQIAACEIGRQRYLALIQKYGWQTVNDCVHAMWDQCEHLMREQIRQIPDGSYTAESFLDDDGINFDKTIPVCITVIVKGDTLTVDYSELAPQTAGPMNAGYSAGVSAAKVAIKSAIVPTVPPNDGTFRPVNVILPPGTIMSAVDNAAMSLWTVTIKTIVDTILRALSQAIPDRIPAAHHGSMGVFIFSGRDENGRPYSTVDSVLGGWGAQPAADGFSPLKTVTHGDTRQVPTEVEETFWPLLVKRYEWIADTAGPGKFRGGLGLRKVYSIPHGAKLTVAFERAKCPPWGLFGGGAAQVGKAFVRQPGSDAPVRYQKVTALQVQPGTEVELHSGGGGGRGPAYERDVQRVLEDVRQGYVSVEGARRDYGVVIEGGILNEMETRRLRESMRSAA
jgi:N-methylhydantoinase B